MRLDAATWLLVGAGLGFTFLNGYNGSASVVGSMVASGAMNARRALLLAGAAELCGPLLFGVAVAGTIGRGVVDPGQLTLAVLVAAILGAVAWSAVAGWIGVPTSSTHALVGGLIGAALAAGGTGAVLWRSLAGVFLALGAAPALGLVGGYAYMKAMMRVGVFLTPAVNVYLKRAQIVTSALIALGHGANEAQKGMCLIAAGLVASGATDRFYVPGWVQLACAVAIALGVALGGQTTLRTVGARIFTIRPVHGFAVQGTTALIMVGASLLGGPASTNQVATSAIFGVGSAERLTKVRWEVGEAILTAWLVTVPTAALVAALLYWAGRAAGLR